MTTFIKKGYKWITSKLGLPFSLASKLQATVKRYEWSDKTFVSRQRIILSSICVLLAFAVFRIAPSWNSVEYVVKVNSPVDFSMTQKAKIPKSIQEGTRAPKLPSTESGAFYQSATTFGSQRASPQTSAGYSGARVLSRPLFDNLTVTVAAELTQGVAVVQGESTQTSVEAKYLGVVRDGSLSASEGSADLGGAVLMGSAQGQFSSRKLLFSFHELVTPRGERYRIQSIAIDPETRIPGVPAQYSSGLGSRFLGATLSRALSTADRLATSRIIQNTDDSNEVSRELMRQSLEASNQPVEEMNQEITRDLRETRSVLSLNAGARFTLRLKAAPAQAANFGGGK